MVDAEDEAHKLELAKDATEATKKHFEDFGLVAQGLWIAQRQAMRSAGSNGPYGGPFKKAMKAWLVANPWAAAYDAPTRTHFVWLHDNRAEVEKWRSTLTANQRDQWTHPTTIHRRFEAAHKVPAKARDAPKKETEAEALTRANEELWATNKKLERQVDSGQGSLFDLRQDSVEAIVDTMARNVSIGRFEALQRGMTKRLAALKAEAKAKSAKAG
jgi:hypothetical protein